MGCMVTSHEEQVDEDENRTDRDARVGNIERPEMPTPKVHVHEIDDVALAETVGQIADRAAEDQRQANAREALLGTHMTRVEADADERVRVVEQPERDALIVDVNQIHYARDDRPALVERQLRSHERFRRLIDNHRDGAQPPVDLEAREARGVRRRLDGSRDGWRDDARLVSLRKQPRLPPRRRNANTIPRDLPM